MSFFRAKDKIRLLLEEKLGSVEVDFPLSKLSFVRLGGRAKYLFRARDKRSLVQAILLARQLNLPHLVVGGASNILFADEGFEGLVIVNQYSRLHPKEAVRVAQGTALAPSGIHLLVLVKELAQSDLGGLEFLATIPGTLGGAVVGNAGAFSREVKDVLRGVNVLNEEGKEEFWPKRKLDLGYRRSILKGRPKKSNFLCYPVVLEVQLELVPRSKTEVNRLVQSHFLIRQKKQPHQPSLGCVFRNPKAPPSLQNLAKDGRISAGYLIDRVGLKGKRRGGIQISEIHANFFINVGRGKAKDYLSLMEETREKVNDVFGILLEEEIEVVPPSPS